MQNNQDGTLFLKIITRALIVGLEEIPMVGAVVKIGRECCRVVQEEQGAVSLEQRIAQFEQAAACTPDVARQVAEEAIAELVRQGRVVEPQRAEAVQDLLATMPAAIRERTHATLNHARRLGVAVATVLPISSPFAVADQETFYASIFPQRRSQFQSGDVVPHYSPEWRLERLIGVGGFGEVWLARHQSMQWKPPMAIKFCQDELSAKLLRNEASNLDTLISKLPMGTANIVPLLDYQFTASPYWLAFEYIDGGTLESRMRLGAMDWSTAWQLYHPLLEGMALVHDLNIVHRDLKPANILLAGGTQPRIVDFGIGKIIATQSLITQQVTKTQTMWAGTGSWGYMSPEQLAGQASHLTDDVYALGVLLWQMLAGSIKPLSFPDEIEELNVPAVVKQALQDAVFKPRSKRLPQARALLELLQQPDARIVTLNMNWKLNLGWKRSSTASKLSFSSLRLWHRQKKLEPRTHPGTVFSDKLKSGIQGPEMVVIGPGKFLMGGTKYNDEQPIHEVTIAYPFAMGKFPVTFAEYDAFCVATGRSKPEDDGFGRDRRPVINVSWDEAEAYCKWLSEQTGNSYRLPSEAEWEYACRAGSTTDYCCGDDVKSLEQYAWFYANSNRQTHPVGAKLPNAWGLYDMHGNVWEWCQDRWHDSYAGAPTTGCAWEQGDSSERVLRGGSWYGNPANVRSAIRNGLTPDLRNSNLGVRVASFAFART